jgi:hypothetical protein
VYEQLTFNMFNKKGEKEADGKVSYTLLNQSIGISTCNATAMALTPLPS